jgi:hypothetical protein
LILASTSRKQLQQPLLNSQNLSSALRLGKLGIQKQLSRAHHQLSLSQPTTTTTTNSSYTGVNVTRKGIGSERLSKSTLQTCIELASPVQEEQGRLSGQKGFMQLPSKTTAGSAKKKKKKKRESNAAAAATAVVEVALEEPKMNIGYWSHDWKIQAPASCSRYQHVPAAATCRFSEEEQKPKKILRSRNNKNF